MLMLIVVDFRLFLHTQGYLNANGWMDGRTNRRTRTQFCTLEQSVSHLMCARIAFSAPISTYNQRLIHTYYRVECRKASFSEPLFLVQFFRSRSDWKMFPSHPTIEDEKNVADVPWPAHVKRAVWWREFVTIEQHNEQPKCRYLNSEYERGKGKRGWFYSSVVLDESSNW